MVFILHFYAQINILSIAVKEICTKNLYFSYLFVS